MPAVTGRRGSVAYELHVDQMEDLPYLIKRVETTVFGEFATREEARQHMIDTADERKERDRDVA